MAFEGTGNTGTILRGQGAGATPKYSTATYPDTAGTIGNILTSDGSNWTSAAPATSGTVTSVSGTTNRITSTGGNTPVIDISASYVGQSSITTLGTITTGVWNGTSVDLAHGGTNANLTASNGGIFYSTATAGAILAGTATAGQIIRSGASTTPSWSTATYPATAGTSGNVLTSDGTNWSSAAPSTSGTVTSVSGTANQVSVATGTTTPVISLIGPYTPATYTAHGVLVGEGTSSIIALAAGTAGQILQSGGASADPTYSTSTYPSTATGTGKILRADGTNWVATTATFPDTAGTSGNVLTSDGTNWSSSPPATGSGILTVTGSITSAQIKACHGTPVVLIAAPAVGSYIYIVGWTSSYKYGGTNVFVAAAAQTVRLFYGTSIAVNTTSPLASNARLVGTGNITIIPAPPYDVALASTAFDNLAITAYNSVSTEISGNAANNNTITYFIQYIIATD